MIRCWQCGVEPLGTVDVSTLGEGPGTHLIPTGWPPGDHEHAVFPPTPGALLAVGAEAFDRVMKEWMR